MIEEEKFKAYFRNNSDFWRAFKNKEIFLDVPKSVAKKEELILHIFDSIKDKTYYPSTPVMYITRNKGKGVSRIIPVFSVKDYCVYYYCIKSFEEKIAYNRIPNTFGGWTLGGVIRGSEDDEMIRRKGDYDSFEEFLAEQNGVSISEYSFNPLAWVQAYGDMNAKLYATAKLEDYKYVAELDIANFYDSVRLDILETRIREITGVENQEEVSLLFHFLNYWNRNVNLYGKQVVGLPQDALADCSRILANFYLQPYDEYVFDLSQKEGFRYFRYADDQFIFADTEEKLKFIIFKISQKLNYLGLNINQKKVVVRKTEELISHRSFEIFDILKEKDTKKDVDAVEKFVDGYLSMLDKDGLKNIKERGNPLLTRALFCPALASIELLRKAKLKASYLDDEYLEYAKATHFEKIYNFLSDEEKLLFIEKLALLSDKLYHNAFHYEVISFLNKIGINSSNIKKRIKELETY